MTLIISIVNAEAVIPLRWQVLRPGLPEAAARYDGDEERTTWHFAAYFPNGEQVGVVSYFLEPYESLPARCAYRLRGMATAPPYQRRYGIGRQLVRESLSFLGKRGVELVWCYARLSAVGFYEKLGFHHWAPAGVVEIPSVGPHEVWYKYLESG